MTAERSHRAKHKIRSAYNRLVEGGTIEADPAQRELVDHLDRLLEQLSQRRLSSKSSSLGWLFGKRDKAPEKPKGMYIWGEVGRGKSMLMDLFFAQLPHKRKRRSHFNDFLVDAQERIHRQRDAIKEGKTADTDPIRVVGREMAEESSILCFDEFTVTNIADAMILGRLFEMMFDNGVIVVATSNVAPQDLYRDGLNRHLFVPFIKMLEDNVTVHELSARTDFRLEKLQKAAVYHHPVDEHSAAQMQQIWERLTGTAAAKPLTLKLKGRELVIPEYAAGVGRIGFDALCVEPRSAEDYLAIARQVHTLFITGVPTIAAENRNVAKRFILLIDTLYDNHVRVVISAAGPPETLYSANKGTEAFEFNRTISRLHEMQSEEYIGATASI